MPPTCPGPATTALVTIILACSAAATNPDADARQPAWRAAFDAVYRLDPGEDARFVPAPFMPERGNYYREVAHRQGNPVLSVRGGFAFFWTDDGKLERWSFRAGDGNVASALDDCGVASWQMEPAGRAADDPKLLAEMLADLERQTGLRFRPEKRPTDVYVIAEDNAG